MTRFHVRLLLFLLWLVATIGLATATYMYRPQISSFVSRTNQGAADYISLVQDYTNGVLETGVNRVIDFTRVGQEMMVQTQNNLGSFTDSFQRRVTDYTRAGYEMIETTQNHLGSWGRSISDTTGVWGNSVKEKAEDWGGDVLVFLFSWLDVEEPETKSAPAYAALETSSGRFIPATYSDIAPPRRLSDVKNATTAQAPKPLSDPAWTPEEPEIEVEAVLVPQRVTVISSSRDGRIAAVLVNHGDHFRKGDLLIAYDCSDLEAEAGIVKMEEDITRKKAQGSDQLFKLDIISDIDRTTAQVQDKQAQLKTRLYEARMKDCEIRAEFEGRVTNRLANAGEYTRTDRVLLEVASSDPLQAEFLLPSKWLRWVNIGAPVVIHINETDKTYPALVRRIHGEVDPASQSIQMSATLEPYTDPLLPGMSGKARFDIKRIREAGVSGYLETIKSSAARVQ